MTDHLLWNFMAWQWQENKEKVAMQYRHFFLFNLHKLRFPFFKYSKIFKPGVF